MRTRIKICGITRLDDALLAAGLGVDALGFVFWPRSPRFLPPRRAAAIAAALPPFVTTVGVFVNQPLDEIRAIAAEVGLSAVQLHGDEPASMWTRVPGRCIKAVGAGAGFDAEAIAAWPPMVWPLLDAHDPVRRGGTGRTIDWDAAARAARTRRIILAGGLDADERPRRDRAVPARSRSTCRRASSARRASRTPPAFARSSKASPRPTPHRCHERQHALHRPRLRPARPGRARLLRPVRRPLRPETLVAPVEELRDAYFAPRQDAAFLRGPDASAAHYAGRPTPLYEARRLSADAGGARIFLKREDLTHTGAHKINNALGQALLAARMGKRASSPRPAPASTAWRRRRPARCSASSATSTWAPRTWSGRRSTSSACGCSARPSPG